MSVRRGDSETSEEFTSRTRAGHRKFGRMKLVIPVALLLVLVAAIAAGERVQPGPVAVKTEEVPTPVGTPEPQGAPDLLPGSSQLPADPPNLRLPSPSMLQPDSALSPAAIKQLSPEEQEKNRARMAKLKAIAMASGMDSF